MKIPTLEQTWFVIRARAGCETLAADELRNAGHDHYLPMRRVKSFIRRQRLIRNTQRPLMPGYLFLGAGKGVQIDWGRLRNERLYPHVGRPLRGTDGPLRIPAKIVVDIHCNEVDGLYDETGATKKQNHAKLKERFAEGNEFRVVEGPFSSFMCISESVTPQERIVALVNIFGRLVRVEFEQGQLEAA
jgi:transcription antitermination factor NusG